MNRTRGFTLVELIVTIGILVILASIGIGAYIGLGKTHSFNSACIMVDSALRAARNSAFSERAPTAVIFEKDADSRYRYLYTLIRQTVSLWHFEEVKNNEIPGAFNQKAVVMSFQRGTPLSDPYELAEGRYGLSYYSEYGSPESFVYLQVFIRKVGSSYLTPPSLNLTTGVWIEAWVNPKGDVINDGQVYPILSKFDGTTSPYEMYLEYDSASGNFRIVGMVTVRTQSGTLEVTSASEPRIKPYEWTHIAISYRSDEDRVKLYVNGVLLSPESEQTGSGPLLINSAPVLIGRSDADYLEGYIDELKVAGYFVSNRQTIPGNVEVNLTTYTGDGGIYFDDYGRLDSRHSEEPRVELSIADRVVRRITVTRSGEIISED